MVEPIETLRGVVNPWESDVTEHFTIAYYFDRIADASVAFRAHIEGQGVAALGARRYDVGFRRELHAGDGLHMESGIIGVDGHGARVGHRLIHSASGEVATWFEETLAPAGRGPLDPGTAARLEGRRIAWDGPPVEERPEPAGTAGFMLAARDRVKPFELDGAGRVGLAGLVHRFSAAGLQALAAIGMDSAYLQGNRRGYSTFELQLRLGARPGQGTGLDVRTAIVHLGGSSIRLLHRMVETESGREVASLGQFGVQLDLDTRRPARLPDAVRERADRLLVTA